MIVLHFCVNVLTSFVIDSKTMNEDIQQILYTIGRFMKGVTATFFPIITTMSMEFVGPKYRVTASTIVYYSYSVGLIVLLILAYFAKSFVLLFKLISILIGIFVVYFWILPESPRFLFAKQKYNEALKIFNRIAASNKRNLGKSDEGIKNLLLNSHELHKEQKVNRFKLKLNVIEII
jgi:hypothetical protein